MKPDQTGGDGKGMKQSEMLNYSVYSRLGNNQKCLITLYIIQLFHTFLCNSQNYHPRGAVPSASGNSASGHPQHRGGDSFDCCTERYEIVVLLPNS